MDNAIVNEAPETIETDNATVSCDGGGDAAMGHPMVYLSMGTKAWVECPYCDRKYILKTGASAH
ncbi:MAG: zinc-finger domain-containing protein [Alphaproteobacteria bacterium]|jgi:uncharacterized Zn-finger protein|nr:zinc-finger domain-containing protein [Rhodospirillaceae bacterium]MDP6023912.1 zinc-finger domain-containing protein [Alphaproteobacteria bacterium]MDP6255220.1 zinc-finger domain-containing protein [Alphaproteobacteria bacterium]MDP7055183.1 zinc-finger domain-containing protein [Alphaproteobacteria bacterium]MDP7228013.1 zinc-finger domain-containing protein [Alphaproteobacteria bacterium]|tara:strand:+ start:890 stop:1081 length:192 start_codon:yes stop_codon:yes gene_type:complete